MLLKPTYVSMLAGVAILALAYNPVSTTDTSEQALCLVWEDWLEHDWFTADDPPHQHITSPHPEISHPWGEWEFQDYACGYAEAPHDLRMGWTEDHHMDCSPW